MNYDLMFVSSPLRVKRQTVIFFFGIMKLQGRFGTNFQAFNKDRVCTVKRALVAIRRKDNLEEYF